MYNILKTRLREGIKTEDVKKNDDNIQIFEKNVKTSVHQGFRGGFSIRQVDSGSCNGCEYEISALCNPYYDLERFGIKFVASPKHADALMVTGCMTRNMRDAVIKAYNNIPAPKFVMAVGDCAMDGGVFQGSYPVMDGVRNKLPIDLWVKGCPPEPLDILSGLLNFITE